MTRNQLVSFYSGRKAVHEARKDDQNLLKSERNESLQKYSRYKAEMFRWMFMSDATFNQLENELDQTY